MIKKENANMYREALVIPLSKMNDSDLWLISSSTLETFTRSWTFIQQYTNGKPNSFIEW